MKKTLLVLILISTMFLLMSCGEGWQRSMKTMSSNYTGGLNRTVTVYNDAGVEIKSYSGKLDIDTNEYGNKILFDLDGKRVMIYNAVVIVEEK